jgi:hypothetical protein
MAKRQSPTAVAYGSRLRQSPTAVAYGSRLRTVGDTRSARNKMDDEHETSKDDVLPAPHRLATGGLQAMPREAVAGEPRSRSSVVRAK